MIRRVRRHHMAYTSEALTLHKHIHTHIARLWLNCSIAINPALAERVGHFVARVVAARPEYGARPRLPCVALGEDWGY